MKVGRLVLARHIIENTHHYSLMPLEDISDMHHDMANVSPLHRIVLHFKLEHVLHCSQIVCAHLHYSSESMSLATCVHASDML